MKLTLLICGLLLLGAGAASAQLPNPGVEFEAGNTALVIIDPQVDFLDLEKGVMKDLVGDNVREVGTIGLFNVIAAETDYCRPFCSMIRRGNLYATQFHPEKSQADGLRILKNFAELG